MELLLGPKATEVPLEIVMLGRDIGGTVAGDDNGPSRVMNPMSDSPRDQQELKRLQKVRGCFGRIIDIDEIELSFRLHEKK